MNLKNNLLTSKQETKKGSVLVFTMFIMVITLVAGMSIMTISTTERRSTLASGKSINAFQIAESGLEIALVVVKTQLATNTLNSVNGSENCDGGKIDGDVGGGEYSLKFYSGVDGNDPITDCSEEISTVTRVKSVGAYRGASRAVEFTVSPT